MGSYASLLRQSAALIAIVALLAVGAAIIGPEGAAWWVVATGTIGLAFFVVVSLRRRREVMRLASEIDEILHEGRQIDLSCYREGDVAVLSNELAKMVARLRRTADLLDKERDSLADALADISHQIRTPLTAMSLMLDAMERTDDAADQRLIARRLEHMIDRVSWLVTALLRLARLDAGVLKMESVPVRISAMVKRATIPLEAAYDLRSIELAIHVDETAAFRGDERWSAEALENIVKNCMEHTPSGGCVTIRAHEDSLTTIITVTDTGPGIAREDLPHVFERFYRRSETGGIGKTSSHDSNDKTHPINVKNGSSKTRPTTIKSDINNHAELGNTSHDEEGFGIGLALSLALVSAQGGTIRASNNPSGGARFDMVFPKLVV